MTQKRRLIWSAVAVLMLASLTVLNGSRQPAPIAAQGEGLELAVYNQDLALVKDLRRLDLSLALNNVRFADVAARIDPPASTFDP